MDRELGILEQELLAEISRETIPIGLEKGEITVKDYWATIPHLSRAAAGDRLEKLVREGKLEKRLVLVDRKITRAFRRKSDEGNDTSESV